MVYSIFISGSINEHFNLIQTAKRKKKQTDYKIKLKAFHNELNRFSFNSILIFLRFFMYWYIISDKVPANVCWFIDIVHDYDNIYQWRLIKNKKYHTKYTFFMDLFLSSFCLLACRHISVIFLSWAEYAFNRNVGDILHLKWKKTLALKWTIKIWICW